jgi:hypothetical protein
MGLATQVVVLAAAPLLALAGMESAARRERALYFTGLLGVLATVFFVINLSVLSGLCNAALSPTAMLAWSAFCWILAYTYGLRPFLIGSILFLMGFVATIANPAEVCVWDAFGRRPENFLPLGILLLAVPLIGPHRGIPSFKPVFRIFGLVCVFMPILILSSAGHASYLHFSPDAIEVGYQLAGFALAALTIWLGIRRALNETTNLGSGFFVVLLYVKFFDWWWDWMPKWLFFLVLGGVAVGILLLLRRLQAATRGAAG